MRISTSITLWAIVCALFGLVFAYSVEASVLPPLVWVLHHPSKLPTLLHPGDLLFQAFLAIALAQIIFAGISSSRSWRRARALLDPRRAEINPGTGAYRGTPPDMPREIDARARSEAMQLQVRARNQLRRSAIVSVIVFIVAVAWTALTILRAIGRID